ncbi:MAG: alpha/beta hydrolase [Pseudomonadota bacterium]
MSATTQPYCGTYTSEDGLALYYRDNRPSESGARTPILCLPGLTRNSRDFEELTGLLCPDYRVIATDLRGRGNSAYDASLSNYHPAQYVQDTWRLLAELDVPRVTVIGTSLGGLMAMLMAQERPEAVQGVVLNDVGPKLELPALMRLISAAGSLPAVRDWPGAVAALRRANGAAYPTWSDAQWQRFAEKMYAPGAGGSLTPRLDPNVGRAAMRGLSGLRQDPWIVFAALQEIPTLLVRGATSSILSEQGAAAMRKAKADLAIATVADRGHAPNLDEPEAIDAIRQFLRTHG